MFHSDSVKEGEAEGPGAGPSTPGGQGCTKPSAAGWSRTSGERWLRTHLCLWEWERDGERWASPAPLRDKGEDPKEYFLFGLRANILIRHGNRAHFDELRMNLEATSQDKLP